MEREADVRKDGEEEEEEEEKQDEGRGTTRRREAVESKEVVYKRWGSPEGGGV